MKYFYYVISCINENGKRYAGAWRINGATNLKGYATPETVEILHPCETWKQARELADFWNECYKNNGTFAF